MKTVLVSTSSSTSSSLCSCGIPSWFFSSFAKCQNFQAMGQRWYLSVYAIPGFYQWCLKAAMVVTQVIPHVNNSKYSNQKYRAKGTCTTSAIPWPKHEETQQPSVLSVPNLFFQLFDLLFRFVQLPLSMPTLPVGERKRKCSVCVDDDAWAHHKCLV